MSETETFHVVDDAVDAQNESADLSVDVRIAHFYWFVCTNYFKII